MRTGWLLLVCGPDPPRVVTLPAAGVVSVGCSASGFMLTMTEVVLDHADVLPHHAQIIVGAQSTIEPIGATTLAGASITGIVPVALDEPIGIGPFTLTLHPARVVIDDPAVPDPSPLLGAIARDLDGLVLVGDSGIETLARALHALSGRPGELHGVPRAALATETPIANGTVLLVGMDEGSVEDVVPLRRLAELDVTVLFATTSDPGEAGYGATLVLRTRSAS